MALQTRNVLNLRDLSFHKSIVDECGHSASNNGNGSNMRARPNDGFVSERERNASDDNGSSTLTGSEDDVSADLETDLNFIYDNDHDDENH